MKGFLVENSAQRNKVDAEIRMYGEFVEKKKVTICGNLKLLAKFAQF